VQLYEVKRELMSASEIMKILKKGYTFFISNFRHVLNGAIFLLGDSLAVHTTYEDGTGFQNVGV
jgi:hypothetical protein